MRLGPYLRYGALVALVAGSFNVATAQQTSAQQGLVQQSPVLTLNQEALYRNSLFGARVQRDLEQKSRELATQNREIEAILTEEEQNLTVDRKTMEPDAFRALADEFDTRVTEIRRAQVLKRDAIQQTADNERARFYELAFPVLLRLVEETGAVAILDNSAVIFSVRNIDITERAIREVNQAIGDAAVPQVPENIPTPRPDGTRDQATGDDPAQKSED